MVEKFFGKKNADNFYFAFRVIVGVLFFLHGLAKLPVVMTGDVTNIIFWAGVIEMLVGVLVVVGFKTRWAAILGAITMLVAFVKVHLGWNPVATKGDSALIYMAAFLALIAYGAGKWAIDKQKK